MPADADQAAVDAAAAALKAAIDSLEEKPVVDRTELEKAIASAEALKAEDYTPESLAALEEAVAAARENAVSGDIVSMSPASASFDMYKNFAEKGLHFKRLVNEMK